MKLPLVIGHRGSRGTFLENTRASFLEAHESGATWIETDLQLSKDNVPMIFHDPMVSGRLCKKNGEIIFTPKSVRTLTCQELGELELGTYVDHNYPKQVVPKGETIVSLAEFLRFAKEQMPGMKINLELKTRHRTPNLPNVQIYATKVAEALQAAGLEKDILISSFDVNIYNYFAKHYPQFPRSRLFNIDAKFIEKIIRTKIKHVTLNLAIVTEERVKKLQEHDVKINVYTANRRRNWRRLIDYGVDGIITDYPRKLIAYMAVMRTDSDSMIF